MNNMGLFSAGAGLIALLGISGPLSPFASDGPRAPDSRLLAQATPEQPSPRPPAPPAAQPAPAPAASPVPASSGVPEVDETALRYFARQGDTRRLEAEIARLRSLYPDWTPPADPLAVEDAGDPELDRMWQLYAQGQYPQVREAIAQRQAREPAWQVPADLLDRLALAEARQQIINASDLKQFETVVRLGADNPSLLTCSDVDVLWRVAAAFAQTDRPARATDAYRYILTNCNDANERLATVQMALPLLPRSDLDQLLALERTGQNGVGEFQPVRVDIARQAVADGGANPDETVAQPDLRLVEDAARASDTAGDPLLLGWYYVQRQAYDDARRWFSMAAEREPTAEAARGLALSLIGLRQFAQAETAMRPYSSESTQSRSVYLAAAANLLAIEPPVSLPPEVLGRIVQEVATGRDAATAEQLGWYSYALNQFQTAGQWFTTSLEWRPDGELAAFGLALTRQRLGDAAGLRAIQQQWAGRSERIANIGRDWRGATPQAATAAPVQVQAIPPVPQQPVAPAQPPAQPTAMYPPAQPQQAQPVPQAMAYAEPAPMAQPAPPIQQPAPAAQRAPAPRVAASGGGSGGGTTGCRGFVPPQTLSAQAALNRAWCLMELNRPMEAAPAFEVGLQTTNPTTRQDAAYGLALAYLRQNLVDKAAVAATMAPQPRARRIELESSILSQRATSNFDAGRPVETIMTLDQRARLVPEQLDLMVLRGYSYMQLRRYRDAERVFKAVAATGNREGIRGLAAVREAMRPTSR
ncbi:tetratricopeptide repeat protein [Aureimonas altamirensis]|uniref:tetratricopeptide repeat protein n=1 Tax=Aureimonas altamirensis TaxID=370622 RepID=UPI002036C9C9|nr:tetratricopeptide repeat protein [Aureimonas altamirensis]MCM2505966.1 tetratricopeptide repeat protein [Aureimonas altamirensis]